MVDKIKAIMADAWQVSPVEIPNDAALNEFRPWDSLGHITMLMALEQQFGVPLNEESIQNLRTLDAVVAAASNPRPVNSTNSR
ncbi:acyl carrier protein [bacterium]|nr:acyl carrier protein [bacterium]